jgi:hypothetical protein
MQGSTYKDVKLFLWLIPCINAINYYLTYNLASPTYRNIATFTIDTIMGYLAWLLARRIIIWLDKKLPYSPNPGKRILIQLLLTLIAGCGTIIFLTESVNWIATSHPVPRSFYTTDIFIISIWFFVVNGIYIGLHYFNLWQASEMQRKKEAEVRMAGFTVSSARKDEILDFTNILGFYIDGEYSVVVTAANKKVLVDSSLDKVEKNLPSSFFFRLNRQFIVHRQVVTGYEKVENGKLNVLLKQTDHLPSNIQVSRTRAPGFKTWLLPS